MKKVLKSIFILFLTVVVGCSFSNRKLVAYSEGDELLTGDKLIQYYADFHSISKDKASEDLFSVLDNQSGNYKILKKHIGYGAELVFYTEGEQADSYYKISKILNVEVRHSSYYFTGNVYFNLENNYTIFYSVEGNLKKVVKNNKDGIFNQILMNKDNSYVSRNIKIGNVPLGGATINYFSSSESKKSGIDLKVAEDVNINVAENSTVQYDIKHNNIINYSSENELENSNNGNTIEISNLMDWIKHSYSNCHISESNYIVTK